MAKPLTGQCSLGHRDIQAPLSCPGSGWPHCSQLGQTLPRPIEFCSLSGHRRPGQPQRPELGVPLKRKAARPPQASFPTLCWPLPYILLLSKHLFHPCLERKEFLSFHCGATSDHRIPSPRVGRCTYPPTKARALPTTCRGAPRAASQPASSPVHRGSNRHEDRLLPTRLRWETETRARKDTTRNRIMIQMINYICTVNKYQ